MRPLLVVALAFAAISCGSSSDSPPSSQDVADAAAETSVDASLDVTGADDAALEADAEAADAVAEAALDANPTSDAARDVDLDAVVDVGPPLVEGCDLGNGFFACGEPNLPISWNDGATEHDCGNDASQGCPVGKPCQLGQPDGVVAPQGTCALGALVAATEPGCLANGRVYRCAKYANPPVTVDGVGACRFGAACAAGAACSVSGVNGPFAGTCQ